MNPAKRELTQVRKDFAKQLIALMAKDEWLTKRMLALLRRREEQLALELSENIGEGKA